MEARIWRHFDFALLSSTFALIAFGLAMIYSATYGTEPGATVDPRVIRQIAYAAAGIGVMVLPGRLRLPAAREPVRSALRRRDRRR